MAELDGAAEAFLREAHFGKLGTVMKDGSPHVTPIWYSYEGGKLIVNTTTDRVKYFNVRRDPRVCLLVDNGYQYLMVMGRARVAKERDAMKDIEALAVRYRGEEEGRKAAKDRYWKMDRVTIEITPEKVVSGL